MQIRWDTRLSCAPSFGSYVSVHSTDCRTKEPSPFSTYWYSHKHKGAGVRCEIGVTIEMGEIVWVHGPFPCGSYPDIETFRLRVKKR